MANDKQSMFGRARDHKGLAEYKSPDEYSEQGDTRVVKDLMFPYHVIAPSPMLPDVEIIVEKVASRGDTVYTDELGPLALKKGEDLGSFFTSDELERRQGTEPEPLPAPFYSEDGEGADQVAGKGDTGSAKSSRSRKRSSKNSSEAPASDVPDNFNEFSAQEMAEVIREKQPSVNPSPSGAKSL
jgi:hypothetical protein